MWLDAIMSTYRARGSINARLAELQQERERVCECNQPGYGAPVPPIIAAASRLLSPEEERAIRLAGRREYIARIQAMVEQRKAALARRREPPRDPVLADADRQGRLPGGAAAFPAFG
jgi:hypothetical protein